MLVGLTLLANGSQIGILGILIGILLVLRALLAPKRVAPFRLGESIGNLIACIVLGAFCALAFAGAGARISSEQEPADGDFATVIIAGTTGLACMAGIVVWIVRLVRRA